MNSLHSFAQLSIANNSSATTLAQLIVGNGITISNATLSSGANATGTFTYTGSNLGLSDGIILTTGLAQQAGNAGTFFSSVINNNNSTDPDVVAISPQAKYDVCELEFDFIPLCDTLRVKYVFGSEEYPRYIQQYNDVFALFLTGPNPSGGNYSARNIATLPNGTTPVSINTVNGGWPIGTGASNPAYYVDNYTNPNSEISYDGYTVPITSVIAIVPCQTYHMKIVVVDALNGRYDSGVFLQSNTFSCTASPVTTLSATDACINNGTATATVTNFNGTPSFRWLPGGQTTATISNLSPGTYSCIVTYPGLCSADTIQVTVGSNRPVVQATTADTICIGSSVQLTANATGGVGPYTYQWTDGLNLINSTVTPLATAAYYGVAIDANGCASLPDTLQVNVRPAITTQFNPLAAICPGNAATLNVIASGGDGNYTYAWSPASGLSSTTLSNPVATTDTTIRYFFQVNDGCNSPADTGSILVQTLPLPIVTIAANQTSGCAPLCVQFSDSIPVNCISSSWTFGDGLFENSCNPNPHCFNTPGTYSITHQLTDANGCTADTTIADLITVLPKPVAAFSFSPEVVFISNPLIQFKNESANVIRSLWNFGDSLTVFTSENSPHHLYADTGCFPVQLIVQNTYGCYDTLRSDVCIYNDFSFYLPNAFTPNNDGINDVFKVLASGNDSANFELMIFDRWGKKIYESRDVNEGWNGSVNNGSIRVQPDVYVWRLTIADQLGQRQTKTGRVTVIY